MLIRRTWPSVKAVSNAPCYIIRPPSHTHTHRHPFSTKHTHSQQHEQQQHHKMPGICFDIDGVLLRGTTPIPGAATTISQLLLSHAVKTDEPPHTPLPFVCLTNGGGMTEQAKADQLNRLLLQPIKSATKLHSNHIILSHTPMAALAEQYSDKLVLIVGIGNIREVMQSYGFKRVVTVQQIASLHPDILPHIPLDLATFDKERDVDAYMPTAEELQSISAIFLLHDPIVWDRELQIVLDVLCGYLSSKTPATHKQTPIYFSNPDLLFSGHFHAPRLAQGAFRVALEALYADITGKPLDFKLFGKPEKSQFRYAFNQLNKHAQLLGYAGVSRAYMIGDNPRADIRGANQADVPFTSILVQTGTIEPGDDPRDQPKHVCKDVTEAVQLIRELEFGGRHG